MANAGAEEEEYLSAKDMRSWAEQEKPDLAKAAELRLRELNAFVTAYENGKLTPEEATERMFRYDHRWGEALRGASAGGGISDEEILAKIDATRKPYRSWRDAGGDRKRIGDEQSR